jgi:hypothetical protein
MEKISSTPLAHNNNKKLAEISSTNTTRSNMLNLDFDSMPKMAKSSVANDVPLRANFKKSNTCGSLFAKCNCSHHSQTIIPLITQTDCDKEFRPKLDRNNKKNQSFSHPDTPVVFTEENRYPDFQNRLRTSQETIFKNHGNQKVEIKHSKRSSSPNIGELTLSNVDIHPEFKVQVIPKSPTFHECRPVLKKGSKSFPSAKRSPSFNYRSFDSDRTFSSSYSVDEESEETELSEKVSQLLVTDLDASSSPTTTVVEIYQKNTDEKSPTKLANNTAEKFFLVRFLPSRFIFTTLS